MADPRKQVYKLMNLATAACHAPPDSEVYASTQREAAQAALMACRLIREHKLMEPVSAEQRRRWESDDNGPRTSAKKKAEPGARLGRVPASNNTAVGRVTLFGFGSKYDGACFCGEAIEVGDRVAWMRKHPVALMSHPECVLRLRGEVHASGEEE